MADQVAEACRDALGALQSFHYPANAEVNAESLARRGADSNKHQAAQLMALQKIELRCRPFDSDLETDKPKTDDTKGAAYLQAQQNLMRSRRERIEALRELMEQGQLQTAAITLVGRLKMNDVPNSTPEDRDIVQRAFRIAQFNSSTDINQQSEDIRFLAACVRLAYCEGNFESAILRDWPEDSPQRQRTLLLAKRVEAAFRANDLTALGGR